MELQNVTSLMFSQLCGSCGSHGPGPGVALVVAFEAGLVASAMLKASQLVPSSFKA